MSVRSARDLTVLELKEKLKALGLACTGNKNELVVRLNEADLSGTWTERLPEARETRDIEAASMATNEMGVTMTEAQNDEREFEGHLCDKYRMEAELDFLRRELELLRVNPRSTSRTPDSRTGAERTE